VADLNRSAKKSMPSQELIESWKKTTALLLEAKGLFSQAEENACSDAVCEFEEFLEHNELELALESLAAASEKLGSTKLRVVELMALAAANMGLFARVRRFDDYLSKARGVPYITKL
jgi:hypothetical protein